MQWTLFQRIVFLSPLIAGILVMVFVVPAAAEHTPSQGTHDLVHRAGLDWFTEYAPAYREAERAEKLLVVNFTSHGQTQQSLEQFIEQNAELQFELADAVLVRLSAPDAVDEGKQPPHELLGDKAFAVMGSHPGVAIIDLRDPEQPFHGQVVSALPFAKGKYYRWQNSYLGVALELPPGTLSQRTMVWAVRVHPDAPASTAGEQNDFLMELATGHSEHQARTGVQGHQGFGNRFERMRQQVGVHYGKEVVAESWSNQGLIDSCLDCVRSWRHSPGHWASVSAEHKMYGYDIRLGKNGIWYGTGIFGD